jgi:hypothetical protein
MLVEYLFSLTLPQGGGGGGLPHDVYAMIELKPPAPERVAGGRGAGDGGRGRANHRSPARRGSKSPGRA